MPSAPSHWLLNFIRDTSGKSFQGFDKNLVNAQDKFENFCASFIGTSCTTRDVELLLFVVFFFWRVYWQGELYSELIRPDAGLESREIY